MKLEGLERIPDVLVWVWLSFLGGSLVGVIDITLIGLEAQSDPNDSARGAPLLLMLINPAVLMVAAPIVYFSAGIAFVLIYYWLGDTVRWMSMACMYVFAITEVVIVGLKYDPLLAWLASYPALFVAAGFSKVVFKRREAGEHHSAA